MLELIIHDGKQEARRADVPNVKGTDSEVRRAEEEAYVLLEQRSASHSTDVKVT